MPIRRSQAFPVSHLAIRIAFVLLCGFTLQATAAEPPPQNPFADWWRNQQNSDYFPIAVWLQDPRNAERYRAAGINLFVGLWRGPNTNQLAQLRQAGIQVICAQTPFALTQKTNPVIAAWMHDDEPDNAQSLGAGKGYGPPITPETIQRDYQRLHAADPSRPVLLNLGQGVAWDNYIGRGVRRNHPEDYAEYIKGADIVSFDIYPVVHDAPEIRGKLEYVPRGVQRLLDWSRDPQSGKAKMVWNCIECTHIGEAEAKATPAQVRAEVWMSLIHGSRGLIYFVHQFKPNFVEAALLADPEMLAAVTAINTQIRELAHVLNSPSLTNLPPAQTDPGQVPVAAMLKEYQNTRYLFAVSMRNQPTRATFTLPDWSTSQVEVLGENRQMKSIAQTFTDQFEPYAVHLYKIGRTN